MCRVIGLGWKAQVNEQVLDVLCEILQLGDVNLDRLHDVLAVGLRDGCHVDFDLDIALRPKGLTIRLCHSLEIFRHIVRRLMIVGRELVFVSTINVGINKHSIVPLDAGGRNHHILCVFVHPGLEIAAETSVGWVVGAHWMVDRVGSLCRDISDESK